MQNCQAPVTQGAGRIHDHRATLRPRSIELVEAITENDLEKTFVFDLVDGQPMPHRVTVRAADGLRRRRGAFTLCSMPGEEPHVQLTVRRYPGGRVTEALHAMRRAHAVSAPPATVSLSIACAGAMCQVAGGLHTPQRGLIEAILNERDDHRLIVFYGWRTRTDALLRSGGPAERDDLEPHVTIDAYTRTGTDMSA